MYAYENVNDSIIIVVVIIKTSYRRGLNRVINENDR